MAAGAGAGNIWTYREAKQKCNEKHSCFVEVETQEHMTLSPYYIGRIRQGIEEKIEHKIHRWKFLDEYGGIIVAYDNIKLLQRSAEIYDESPLLHFDIKVNYIIFKPEVGKKLIGVVNKTSSTHVGCLVHGRFNASLAKPRSCMNGWVGSNLQIGTEFTFRVLDLRTVAGVLSIAGHVKEKDIKDIKHSTPSSTQDHQFDHDTESKTENHRESKKILTKRKHKERELDGNQNSTQKNKVNEKSHRTQDSLISTSESDTKTNDPSVKKRKKSTV